MQWARGDGAARPGLVCLWSVFGVSLVRRRVSLVCLWSGFVAF